MSLDRWTAAEWETETLVSIVPPVLPDGLCALASCLGNQLACLLILRAHSLGSSGAASRDPVFIPVGK